MLVADDIEKSQWGACSEVLYCFYYSLQRGWEKRVEKKSWEGKIFHLNLSSPPYLLKTKAKTRGGAMWEALEFPSFSSHLLHFLTLNGICKLGIKIAQCQGTSNQEFGVQHSPPQSSLWTLSGHSKDSSMSLGWFSGDGFHNCVLPCESLNS